MRQTIVHGPMWQMECEDCNEMGEPWETEEQAYQEAREHSCVLMFEAPRFGSRWGKTVSDDGNTVMYTYKE